MVYGLTSLMWVSSWTDNAPHFPGSSSSSFDSWARNVCFLHQNRPWFLQDIHTTITAGNKNWHGFQLTFVRFGSCLWVPAYSWSPPPYTHLLFLPACLWTLNFSMRHEDKESQSRVAQSCPTLWDPMDCSLPGSSVHTIFQARILEWLAISFSRVSSWPTDWTQVFHIVGRHFTIWATREVLRHEDKALQRMFHQHPHCIKSKPSSESLDTTWMYLLVVLLLWLNPDIHS